MYRKPEHAEELEKLGCKPIKLDLSDSDAVTKTIVDNKGRRHLL